MYYTYILRCQDNSLYTGITTDLKRRMQEHFSRTVTSVQNIRYATNLKNWKLLGNQKVEFWHQN